MTGSLRDATILSTSFPNDGRVAVGPKIEETLITNVLSKVMGALLIVIGLPLGLAPLAVASFVNPTVQADAWWSEFWNGMERGGWGGLGMGLVMVAVGGWLLVVPSGSADEAGSKPAKKGLDVESR